MSISLYGLSYDDKCWVRIRRKYERDSEPEVPEVVEFDVILLLPDYLDPRKFSWCRGKLYTADGIPLEEIKYECYIWAKTSSGLTWVETTIENALDGLV